MGTRGTLRDASTSIRCRLGAERSLVQIQSPRFSADQPRLRRAAISAAGRGSSSRPRLSCGVCLAGDEGAVERGEGEASELIRVRARGVEAEDHLHLIAQALQGHLAHPVDDPVDLAFLGVDRLGGHDDEDAQEVGVSVERRGDGLDDRRQMFGLRADAPAGDRQGLEEPLGAALHHREQHALLRAEVVVDRARRDSGLVHERGDRGGLVALFGHQALGRIENGFAGARAAAIGGHLGPGGHAQDPTKLELTLQK